MFVMLTGTSPSTVEPFSTKQLHQKMVSGEINSVPTGVSSGNLLWSLIWGANLRKKNGQIPRAFKEYLRLLWGILHFIFFVRVQYELFLGTTVSQ